MRLADLVAFFYRFIVRAKPSRVVRCPSTGPVRVYVAEKLIPRWAGGVTLGRNVFIVRKSLSDPCMLRHELTHVRQMQRDGLLFPIKYAWYWLRRGYRQVPYEVEAYEAGRECMYTHRECPPK